MTGVHGFGFDLFLRLSVDLDYFWVSLVSTGLDWFLYGPGFVCKLRLHVNPDFGFSWLELILSFLT